MIDSEKLQKLFQAALKDPSEEHPAPSPVFPTPPSVRQAAIESNPELAAPVCVEIDDTAPPAANTGMAEAASAELKALLDEQIQRKNGKRRREMIGRLVFVCLLIGGSSAWLVQTPGRVEALKQAIHDIHEAGDLKTMVAKYQQALHRVAQRSQQINAATESLGVSADQDHDKDPNFNAEMKAMMAGEGKTSGERNGAVQKAFTQKLAPAAAPHASP